MKKFKVSILAKQQTGPPVSRELIAPWLLSYPVPSFIQWHITNKLKWFYLTPRSSNAIVQDQFCLRISLFPSVASATD